MPVVADIGTRSESVGWFESVGAGLLVSCSCFTCADVSWSKATAFRIASALLSDASTIAQQPRHATCSTMRGSKASRKVKEWTAASISHTVEVQGFLLHEVPHTPHGMTIHRMTSASTCYAQPIIGSRGWVLQWTLFCCDVLATITDLQCFHRVSRHL
jgi:hypothetical protein